VVAQKDGPDRAAYRWATETKVRAKIKAYRRRALDRAVGRLAGMVQIVCSGRNVPWRHMKAAFRGARGDTETPATLNCNLLLNHAEFLGFCSPDLEGFTGISHSVEDCLYQAEWGMREFLQVMNDGSMPVPPRIGEPTVLIKNAGQGSADEELPATAGASA
jgi:hypothetical protein